MTLQAVWIVIILTLLHQLLILPSLAITHLSELGS